MRKHSGRSFMGLFGPSGPRGGTTAGGMTFYERQFSTAFWDGLSQVTDAFNEASGNTIVLETGAETGRKPAQTILDTISGLIQSRNPSGTGTVTPSTFANSEHLAIKIFRTAKLNLTEQDWVDMGLSDEEGTRVFGEQFAAAQAQDYLNTVLSALVGGITAIGSTAIHDITGETLKTLNYDSLNTAAFKFGDRRQALRSIIAFSKPMRDMVGQAFASQAIAFQVGNIVITSGGVPMFGLVQVMTDADALHDLNGSATDTYNSLLLVPGAAMVRTGAMRTQSAPIIGTETAAPENQKQRLSIEYEYEIKIKGVSYKSASADNPNNAALATSSNWELVASDVKMGPGVKIKSE